MNPNDLATQVQARLQASEPLRKEFVELVLSWFEDQPASQLADAEDITTILANAFLSDLGQQQIESMVQYLWSPEQLPPELNESLVGSTVPNTVIEAVEERLGRPFSYPPGILEDVLDPAFIRRILAEALADTLEDFVQRSPLAGSSGILGSLARGAGRVGQKGSSFFSGVGAELQKSLSAQAKDFAHRSADTFRQQLTTRLRSPENAEEFAAARHQLLTNILQLHWQDIRELGSDPGPEELAAWLQQILKTNLLRDEVLAAIQQYIENQLTAHRDLSVGELLHQTNVRESVMSLLSNQLDRAIATVVETSEFHRWLSKCFSDPDES
ncbi:MAG: hypothetical protein CMH54_10480 [Myxococcales bacterium]|nr:hypothetical protein [Myxococcales bacterium]